MAEVCWQPKRIHTSTQNNSLALSLAIRILEFLSTVNKALFGFTARVSTVAGTNDLPTNEPLKEPERWELSRSFQRRRGLETLFG